MSLYEQCPDCNGRGWPLEFAKEIGQFITIGRMRVAGMACKACDGTGLSTDGQKAWKDSFLPAPSEPMRVPLEIGTVVPPGASGEFCAEATPSEVDDTFAQIASQSGGPIRPTLPAMKRPKPYASTIVPKRLLTEEERAVMRREQIWNENEAVFRELAKR